ncbi:MAG: hypothetical protein AAGD43_30460 [Pseudomonadota bacterium]
MTDPGLKQHRRTFNVATLVALALVVVVAAAPSTSAQEQSRAVCVQCMEPDVSYRCQVKAAPEHQPFLGNERLIRVACIRHIAKASGHAVCKASKQQAIDCVGGEPYTVDISEMAQSYVDRVPSVVRKALTPAGPKVSEGQGEEDKAKPPKTVVEMAKRTAETSQKQLEDAGTAVKNAGDFVSGTVKQTWTCLASLFQDC